MIFTVLKDVVPSHGDFPGKADAIRRMTDAVHALHTATAAAIRSAVEKNQVILNGPAELTGVNVFNARCHHGYITSTYFLMYREGEENRMLRGNFVIKMQDEKTIAAVYRCN